MAKSANQLLEELRLTNPDLAAQVAAATTQPKLLGREQVIAVTGTTYPKLRRLVDEGIVTPTAHAVESGQSERWDPVDTGRLGIVATAANFCRLPDQALRDLWAKTALDAPWYYMSQVGEAYLIDVEPPESVAFLAIAGAIAVACRAEAEALMVGGA